MYVILYLEPITMNRKFIILTRFSLFAFELILYVISKTKKCLALEHTKIEIPISKINIFKMMFLIVIYDCKSNFYE